MQKPEFRICALEGCKKLFMPTVPNQIYCSQECREEHNRIEIREKQRGMREKKLCATCYYWRRAGAGNTRFCHYILDNDEKRGVPFELCSTGAPGSKYKEREKDVECKFTEADFAAGAGDFEEFEI